MVDLSAEITAARPEEQREVLERLYDMVIPREYGTGRKLVWGSNHALCFTAMLDCGAFLSAVEMLVPEGCLFGMGTQKTGLAVGALFDKSEKLHHEIEAATPALALAAAIAKSLEGREDR